ncbi:MAG: peptidylprolyl isomerase [Clostridia bacterium]|nr:peptidylprolyl isomerase [Clostridia bacterium]
MSKKHTPPKKNKPVKVNPYAKKPEKNNHTLIIAVVAIVCICLVACLSILFGDKNDTPVSTPTAVPSATLTGTHKIEIDIQDYGTIKAELYADVAPITVENFLKLAREGFYDGLTFHRIISGFMIQGGDPLGNGTGGSDQKIKGEFAANGVSNPLKHTRGVLSMARAMAYDSASSQFFIMHQDYPSLDGQYAAFGMVTEGIEIVDQICAKTPVTDSNGSVAKGNQPVITAIRVVE